ncbi:flavin reductase family protein [Niallia nealsonii]|uniref:Flavin reductase like domain-containing protein n=1 Tax=Niallia nealsonii TaxID=115979 RepID=A0A2N0YX48_9BACI|nr:flavin reductase family protein [Niallia nealsonii]PKG21828.1 hypothetical protein CWS01_20425 [Niallia nealsonii]
MFMIDPASLSPKDVYKFLIGSILPRPIAFVTSIGEESALNGAPFSFFNIVSSDPPILSIAIQRKDHIQKDTARNISLNKDFVVHICDQENIEKINETAASLPSNQSEIEYAHMQKAESAKISTPGITEAKIRIECKLESIITITNDEGKPTCDLILGRAVCFHIQEELYKDGKIDAEQLKPVARLAGDNYSKLGEMFSIKRPN